MVGEGILEISGERIKTAREDIRKLKFILDGLGIMHIIDDVMFFSPFDMATRMREIHNVRVLKIENAGGVSLKNRVGHNGRFKYRELIIPGLFENNFTRLLLMDYEEYEFLGSLLYGAGY